MTYAANEANFAGVAASSRYRFTTGDIADTDAVVAALSYYEVDAIINFAAETHVDRSILDAGAFLRTDIVGTHVLLDAARTFKNKFLFAAGVLRVATNLRYPT